MTSCNLLYQMDLTVGFNSIAAVNIVLNIQDNFFFFTILELQIATQPS